MYPIQLGVTTYPVVFALRQTVDGQTLMPGQTPTVKLSKNGGVSVTATGTVSEIDAANLQGLYKLVLSATDINTLGPMTAYIVCSGAVTLTIPFLVVNYNPYDTSLGLARLDAAVSTRATPAQILTTPANLLATDGTGRVTVATNADKAGYALTTGEHTNVASDVQTGLTAQGFTPTRAGYLDTLNGLVAAIWNAAISNTPTIHTMGETMSGMWTKIFGKVTEPSANVQSYTGTDGTTAVLVETYTPNLAAATGRTTNRS